MSVVAIKVYKDKIEIASDSITVRGQTQEKRKYGKLIKVNDIIVGSVGLSSEISLLKSFLQNKSFKYTNEDSIIELMSEYHQWLKKTNTNKNELFNDYIFVFNKKAFHFTSDFHCYEIKNFASIGAGSDFAKTALHLGKSVKEAVAIACELSIYCEKPINFFSINK